MVPKWSPALLPIVGWVKQNCHEANKIEKSKCLMIFMIFILKIVEMIPKWFQNGPPPPSPSLAR